MDATAPKDDQNTRAPSAPSGGGIKAASAPSGGAIKAAASVRQHARLSFLACVLVAVFLLISSHGLSFASALARAAVSTGAAGMALGALLLSLTGDAATSAILRARHGGVRAPGRRWLRRFHFESPGDAARRGQGSLVPLIAALAALAAWSLRPGPGAPAFQDTLIVAALLLVLAFPFLVAERAMAATRTADLPEAEALRALRLLPVLGLASAAAIVLAIGAGWAWTGWIATLLCWLIVAIAVELAARALARWFLPPPAAPRAAITSLIAAMITGMITGMIAGSVTGGMAAPLRSQLGIDMSRSWALGFLRRAAMPAFLLSALLCWGLTGLVAIEADRRGVYERFGAGVAVWGPGLHLGLPWPLGRVRLLQYGPINELALAGRVDRAEIIPAEAPLPASADRLWDAAHPGEITYLIASETAGKQSFQAVSADIRVLWRIGLSDADARAAAYGTEDPEQVVRSAARRRLALFFAGRTLDNLLGERREAMAETLRKELSDDIAPIAPGIEIVTVVIEAVHPPAGAARAYHAVAAAAIDAQTSVALESGWAAGTFQAAATETHRLITQAEAAAADTTSAATAEATRFAADRKARAAGGQAFLFERYLDSLTRALPGNSVTLVDHRLDPSTVSVIDLRPLAGTTDTSADTRGDDARGADTRGADTRMEHAP